MIVQIAYTHDVQPRIVEFLQIKTITNIFYHIYYNYMYPAGSSKIMLDFSSFDHYYSNAGSL